MKIAVNKCYGGFGLSTKAVMWLIEKKSSLITKTTVEKYTGGRGLEENEKLKDVGSGFEIGRIEQSLYDKKHEFVWFDNARDCSNRSHPDLIAVIEALGDEASGRFAEIKIVEIPDGIEWEIDDYDGVETIHEIHQSW